MIEISYCEYTEKLDGSREVVQNQADVTGVAVSSSITLKERYLFAIP